MVAVEIARVAGLATVQDGGRPGHMHEGVPPGGALVPELLARANGAVGNPAAAAAIEVFGTLALTARGGALTLATDDGHVETLAGGNHFTLTASRGARVRYVAVRGGIDVPLFLGGRGTLLVAGVGGFRGRGLQRADVLEIGAIPSGDAVAGVHPPVDALAPIRVIVGPDDESFDDAALATLLGASFTVLAASDRTGIRLAGPSLRPRSEDDAPPAPMIRGAIQIPSSGDPIVMGPDHPTTGGYRVLATIVTADWSRFAARAIGARVRFAAMTVEAARREARREMYDDLRPV